MNCRKWLEMYSTDCRLKYGDNSTSKVYSSCAKVFLERFVNYREPKEIPTQEIKMWVLEAKTVNTRRNRICAVKSFYSLTVGMPCKIDKIPYPRKEKKLPIVLSPSEIQRMFDVCENKKHKVILALLYSCGLRSSELVNLKWAHIDRANMVINIVAGKGKKDRKAMLSPDLIPLLENYYRQYKSIDYVLNGQGRLKYSQRSVLEVVKQLAEKAKIRKAVWTHLIRHCVGTHMVDAGTDINLIQRIFGHSSSKTTAIYTHISQRLISNIPSPLSAIAL